MFINTTAFKRLIKDTYNTTGLTVGATEEEYFFEGGTWEIRVNKENLPNKEKAAVIELAGELPGPGEAFKALKKCANQYLIDNPAWDIRKSAEEARLKLDVTRAVYETSYRTLRVLQSVKDNTCITIDETFMNLISEQAMDREKESIVIGPVADGNSVYWRNNIMTLAAGVVLPVEGTPLAEYLQLLANVELEKKKISY